MSGEFNTHASVRLKFRLPEFSPSMCIETKIHVTDQKSNYDMILGRDVLRNLGIKLNFDTEKITIRDSEVEVNMKPLYCTRDTHYVIAEPSSIATEKIELRKY